MTTMRTEKTCPVCDDGEGSCVFPYYGVAPHAHAFTNPDSHMGWIGSTRVLPKDQWPENFEEDPDCPGCGSYLYCPACGAGEKPGHKEMPCP